MLLIVLIEVGVYWYEYKSVRDCLYHRKLGDDRLDVSLYSDHFRASIHLEEAVLSV